MIAEVGAASNHTRDIPCMGPALPIADSLEACVSEGKT